MDIKYIARVFTPLLLAVTPWVVSASDAGQDFQNPREWSGTPLELTVEQKKDKIQLTDDKTCEMYRRAYNKLGDEPTARDRVGPTIIVKSTDTFEVTLKNKLNLASCDQCNSGYNGVCPATCLPVATIPSSSNITNFHTHGLHVNPGYNADGTTADNVLIQVKPGATENYKFILDEYKEHPSGTFWYHAHEHGSTAMQVEYGLAGALIIEGGAKDLSKIKEIGDAKEKIFIFQQMKMECTTNGSKKEETVTLINGQYQPVITMQPGEVQRWRFIHAGIRETITLGMSHEDEQTKTNVKFHEIAVDGLNLSKMKNKALIRLQPGYRSDVLVKMPLQEREYKLYDMKTSAIESLQGIEESLKLLATIRVTGDVNDMGLPSNKDFKGYQQHEPITDEELVGQEVQNVTFNVARAKCDDMTGQCTLCKKGENCKFKFMISQDDVNLPNDEKKYYTFPHHAHHNVPKPHRLLPLGKAQKWLLKSAFGNHPYHIHVNPFEHIIRDKDGNIIDRIWRDTLLVSPNNSKTPIEIRTRYENYKGAFVMHCHNLEHEDKGMMECIKVVDNPSDSNAPENQECKNPKLNLNPNEQK